MKYFVSIGTREFEVDLGPDGTFVDGDPIVADLLEMDGTDVHSLLLGAESFRVLATKEAGDRWSLHLAGRHLLADVVDERTRAIRAMAGGSQGPTGPKALKAPMPGLVVKIDIAKGDLVQPGQGLVIVEAMKMENELKAEGEGRVSRVLIEPGQAVEKDQVLVEFEAPEETTEKGSEDE
jgi:pyruvate carboxylase subunit B